MVEGVKARQEGEEMVGQEGERVRGGESTVGV